MSSNCCQDFKFSFKKSYSQEEGNPTIFIKTPFFEAFPFVFSILVSDVVKITVKEVAGFYKPPPPEVFPKIHIKNCVYLI